MPTTHLLVDGEAYQVRYQPAGGWEMTPMRRWEGYRVQYRKAGEFLWKRYLLVDHDHEPTMPELVETIRLHAGDPCHKVRVD